MINIIDLLAHKSKRAFIFACRSLFVAIKLFTLQYSQMHLSNSKVFNTVLKTQDFLSSHWSRSVCQFSLSHAEGDNLVYHMG